MSAEPEPPPEPDSLSLAADFPAADLEQWRAAVSAVLAKSGVPADADPVAELSFTTYDGIIIRPLYTAEDTHSLAEDGRPGHPPFVRGASEDGAAAGGWDVRARHADPDAARTSRAVLEDLERGATSLWLVLGDAGIAVDDLPAVLDGVYLDLAPIVLDAGGDTERAAFALLSLAEQRGVDRGDLAGSLGADPIGLRARTGAPADLSLLLTLVEQSKRAPRLHIATVDATVYHEAGASDAQELGVAASVGVAYLRALVDGGLSVDDALVAIEFRYAVTAEQFPSIAKLRAARRIWDRIAELSGAGDDRPGQHQHAVTSAAMLTQRDPWVNLLRGTIGCFAAAIGGAAAVTVLPFDAAIGLPDDFSRRIARNTQAVLHDESSLARVLDAAGGSWFVEALTDELAEKAWTVFTDLERAGGALAALDDGTLADLLNATQEQRADDIAHRRAPITGVTEFAFVGEPSVERAAAPAVDRSAALLPALRYAQDFEELRDLTDEWAEHSGQRPKVFLAGLGSLAASAGRSGFAANLFQSAGLECVTAAGNTDELVAAFRDSGTTVACLCSTDKIYTEAAAPAAAALREAGATQLWLAGKHETDGVDGYVHVGCDALAVLRSTVEMLGVN
ncbi:methylmalonyl-CoA mutase family protein [uncultured Jatrophihabitans sp.]|uniref:methylmalonyl-CoA mutase family protein n=1 Tax=uncultured Jatrophihabitans sp. TaxID=1610747 RepID=UPI0035C9E6D4